MRWAGIGLGCVTALGLEAALGGAARLLGVQGSAMTPYLEEFFALLLAGFVAGHFAARWEALNGALAAAAYIFVGATLAAASDASVARSLGPEALGPLDFSRLALEDVVALTAASLGGWLARHPRTLPRSPSGNRPRR